MSTIYLVNLSNYAIVGKFEDAATASIAGEELLGTDGYYVGDEIDLEKFSRKELARMLASLGEEMPESKVNHAAKETIIKRIVVIADVTEFAPPAPAPEVKVVKAKKERSPKAEGSCAKLWVLYDSLVVDGARPARKDALAKAIEQGFNPGTAATQWQKWSHKG